jgi:hypothetical protein
MHERRTRLLRVARHDARPALGDARRPVDVDLDRPHVEAQLIRQ